jgi:Domain of unknown function (DUF4333)
MTNPPQDDDRDGGARQQPAPWQPQTGPVQPPQPAPGSQYGQWQQPYGAGPAQQPYGPPSYGQGQGPQGAPPPGWGQAPSPYGQAPYPQAQYGPPQYAQGAYGQPPYGPPQPARKSKAGLVAAVAGGVLLLVVAGLGLAFALRSEVLDPRAVERDVAAQFEQREGVAVDLDCSDDMKVDVGASYECTGVTADEEPVTLEITITDEEGPAYTWTEP